MSNFVYNFKAICVAVWKVVKAVGVITSIGFAYWWGKGETDRLVVEATSQASIEATQQASRDIDALIFKTKEEAERTGFEKGKAEQAQSYLSQDSQTELLAKILGKVLAYLQKPEITRVIDPIDAAAIENAAKSVANGDFIAANDFLPRGVQFIERSDCIPYGKTFTVVGGEVYKICTTGSTLIIIEIRDIYDFGVYYTFNGIPDSVILGRRKILDKNCYIANEKKIGEENELSAIVTIECE